MPWKLVYVTEPQWTLPAYEWGIEREVCFKCRHYDERLGGAKNAERNRIMVCKLNTSGRPEAGTCIDMRYSGPCGRRAVLFQPERRDRRTRPADGSKDAIKRINERQMELDGV